MAELWCSGPPFLTTCAERWKARGVSFGMNQSCREQRRPQTVQPWRYRRVTALVQGECPLPVSARCEARLHGSASEGLRSFPVKSAFLLGLVSTGWCVSLCGSVFKLAEEPHDITIQQVLASGRHLSTAS